MAYFNLKYVGISFDVLISFSAFSIYLFFHKTFLQKKIDIEMY